ncbi:MAG: YdiU family protein [Nitrospirae bacterium]|nr:YdiU family protein [Nitrospirota bacterium]
MSSEIEKKMLAGLRFDNRFTQDLPADRETENYRREVQGACYSRVSPKKMRRPKLVAYSRELADEINLSSEVCESFEFLELFSGNRLLDGMDPYASCYGGHQFGSWAGQLGDGRAINLGEMISQKGRRWTLQLKGAGPTPYSRSADGLAVLRSSLREFLCSEAMFHLGVPTTRALSLIESGEEVIRDMFYNGNPRPEPGAIVCRAAPSFTRFGHFQIFTSRGELELLKRLMDYTILVDFPHLGKPSPETYITWFEEVCKKTAEMIIHWMRVGFVHGVMNTDNMSVLGLTIDYGPYGWLENYDPDWTPNTTDSAGRRYRYIHQPQIAHWNLLQLAYAIYPLVGKKEPFEQALNNYSKHYENGWQAMMAQKLGLTAFQVQKDDVLTTELLALLQAVETDMTIFYRNLSKIGTNESWVQWSAEALSAQFSDAYYRPEQITEEYKVRFGTWMKKYISRLREQNLSDDIRRIRMNRVNPKYVFRNYLAQLAIDKAEQGDYSMVHELHDLLRKPYEDQPEKEDFAGKRPEWARKKSGCSMLSCSS